MIKVLDEIGYVKLKDKMGSDLSVVNAARVSYDRESEELNDRDVRLINFLIREKHTSPLRHATLTFEVYAPLFVARQWWKHAIGSSYETLTGWNESSRRYITENEEFYIPAPNMWRREPENSKQGSGGLVIDEDELLAAETTFWLSEQVNKGVELYEKSMELGIAPEQARLFLPAYAMYVRYVWTTSLQSALHFLDLRLDNEAQWEIQEYAKAVKEIVKEHYPVVYEAWNVEVKK